MPPLQMFGSILSCDFHREISRYAVIRQGAYKVVARGEPRAIVRQNERVIFPVPVSVADAAGEYDKVEKRQSVTSSSLRVRVYNTVQVN